MRGRPTQVLIESLTVDRSVQVRAALCETTVVEYAEAMKEGAKFPPIVVFQEGKKLWLAEGFTRVEAARRIGRKNLAAQVERGGKHEATWYALGANRTHGLRLSAADKRRAVRIALEERPHASDRMIAEHVGCGHPMVAAIRRELAQSGRSSTAEIRTGSDNRQFRNLPRVAPVDTYDPPPDMVFDELPPPDPDELPPEPEEELPPPPDEDGPPDEPLGAPPMRADPPVPRQNPPEPNTAAPPAARVLDQVGQEIKDDRIAELFARRSEIRELLDALSRVKVAVERGIDSGDKLYSFFSQSNWVIDIGNVIGHLKLSQPYAICPYCGGGNNRCSACRGVGFVTKLIYDAAPRDLKRKEK